MVYDSFKVLEISLNDLCKVLTENQQKGFKLSKMEQISEETFKVVLVKEK